MNHTEKKCNQSPPGEPANPALEPIKLPRREERTQAPPRARAVHSAGKGEAKSNLLAAAVVVLIVGWMGGMLFCFPSYQAAQLFLPKVSRADLAADELHDWRGRRAAGNIPRLTGTAQLEDGTFNGLDYLTVETEEIIPLGHYRLKDFSDSRPEATLRAQARTGRRPLREYVEFAGPTAMFYGQYALIRLEDGSYLGAYLDASYSTVLGPKRLPIGRTERVGTRSREYAWLAEAARRYPVTLDYLLVMHSDTTYPDIKPLDYGLRGLVVVSLPLALLGGGLLLVRRKKRGETK